MSQAQAKAFLIVFSEPGDLVSLDEFQDWYNNEHVPLRLNNLPFFLSGARFQSTSPTPTSANWAALYEITDTSIFQKPEYTGLREKRSPREADLVKRLGVLDRRTFEVVRVEGQVGQGEGLVVGESGTKGIVTHGIKDTSTDLNSIKGQKGWKRSWVLRLLDHGTTAKGAKVERSDVPDVFVVHEFGSAGDASAAASSLEKDNQYSEVRSWELYRAYPCVAQGNLPSNA
ncbi:hypothetical protein V5O48_000655 [Marasmius crinis-equi]|uniref:EthD domain-containing protein n=1 Tax=Marasmius crinis-equi TaxID=585013 RepID=A0ABR3G0N2_9AGAR